MFQIRRMGCNGKHGSNFMINRPNGWDCYLLLYIKTRAFFTFNGTEQLLEPNTLILYNKNSSQIYRAADSIYINDWIQFEGDEALLDNMMIPFDKPMHIGNNIQISSYLTLIVNSFYSENQSKKHIISMLMYSMLLNLSDFIEFGSTTNPHYQKLLKLRKEIYNQPANEWSVKLMSEQMHLSLSYFQEIYKDTFGITCIADVINSRIEYAKELLTDTNCTAYEISFACGYNSDVHFSRQFKQTTGITPTEYRKTNKNLSFKDTP